MQPHDNDGHITEIAEELKSKPHHFEKIPRAKQFSWIKFAIFLIVMGAIMYGIGAAMGGRGASFYWDGGLQVHAVNRNQGSQPNRAVTTMTQFQIPFSEVNVDTISARIEVVHSDSYAVEVIWHGERAFQVDPQNVHNGVLIIDTRQAERNQNHPVNIGVGSNNTNVIRIHAPSVTELTLNSVSGRIVTENVEWTRLTATSVSGRVQITNNSNIAEFIDVQSVSGRIQVEGVQWQQLEAQTVSGRIEIRGIPYGNTNMNTVSGRIEMEVIDRRHDEFNYDFTSVSGRVEVDGTRVATSIHSGRRNISQTVGNDAPWIRGETLSGRIEINFSPTRRIR